MTEPITGRNQEVTGDLLSNVAAPGEKVLVLRLPEAATRVMYTFYLAGTLAEELDYAI